MKTLLFSDVKGNKIHQWSEAKGSNVFLSPGGHTGNVPFFEGGVLGSNGLALDAAGNLVICQHGDRRLAKLAFDNITQEGLSTLTATFEGKRFNSPNDLTIAANGDIYFTDPPYGHCDLENSVIGEEMAFVDDKREIPYQRDLSLPSCHEQFIFTQRRNGPTKRNRAFSRPEVDLRWQLGHEGPKDVALLCGRWFWRCLF